MTSYDYGSFQHYGVLGMKWGVRRYQNYDGTLTNLGKKHAGYSSTSSKHRHDDKDITFRKGTTFGRIQSTDKDEGSRIQLYVNSDNEERSMYKRIIGSHNLRASGKSFVTEYTAQNDIKIPSYQKQTQMELDILKDPEVRAEMTKSLKVRGIPEYVSDKLLTNYTEGSLFAKKKLSDIGAQKIKSYEDAKSLKIDKQLTLLALRSTMGDAENVKAHQAFFGALKENGYNGYIDTFDKSNPKIRSKSSFVLVNPSENVKLTSAHEMTREEYGEGFATEKKRNAFLGLTNYNRNVKEGMERYDKLIKAFETSQPNQ